MSRLRTFSSILFLVTALASSGSAQGLDGARYKQIKEMIEDNLQFTAHLTWAVTSDTIVNVRGRITAADIPILVRMMGDNDGRASVAASALLTTLGDAAVPALQKARHSPDDRISSGATDALIRLEECRNNPKGMNPAACP